MFFKKKIVWITVSLVVLSFFLGIFITRAQQESGGLFENLRLFSQVFSIVKSQYVEEVDTQKLIYGAINGMLSSLNDPHTHFMEPQKYNDLQVETHGEFGGLGIEIGLEPLTKQLIVIAPMEGTPADRAGVKAGDKIVEIDGKSTAGITLQEAVGKLRGPKGTQVTITVKRDGIEEPLYFTIIRDIIQLKAVKAKCMLKDDIGYIRLVTFNQHVGREVEEALRFLEERKMKGLILDLRNNPGGLLEQAVEVANKFISEGLIVSTRGRAQPEIKYFARTGAAHPHFPLIVLVNRGSASASEIVAGAIKDNKRGLILGTKTFGKGSVQTVMNLEDGSGIAITTARYYTPSGVCIQDTGIQPDIEVEEEKKEDPELANMLQILKTNNCFVLFAKEKGDTVSAESFNLDESAMNSLVKILDKKNIDFTKEKLNKYRDFLEKEIKIELANLKGKEEGLRMALSFDPVVCRALDLLKGVQILTQVATPKVKSAISTETCR